MPNNIPLKIVNRYSKKFGFEKESIGRLQLINMVNEVLAYVLKERRKDI